MVEAVGGRAVVLGQKPQQLAHIGSDHWSTGPQVLVHELGDQSLECQVQCQVSSSKSENLKKVEKDPPKKSFFYRPSSALISWFYTRVLLAIWGTFCAGSFPNVQLSFLSIWTAVGFEPPTS